jgi:hypothetical protein
VVVWHVDDTARTAFDVDDYENFVKIQSEAPAHVCTGPGRRERRADRRRTPARLVKNVSSPGTPPIVLPIALMGTAIAGMTVAAIVMKRRFRAVR